MAKSNLDDLEAVRAIVAALEGFATIEQERIIRWAKEKLGHSPLAEARSRVHSDAAATPTPRAEAATDGRPLDIKTFVDGKAPKSDVQFATTIAYYYRFAAPPELRKDSVNANDLVEACRQVGRRRIKHALQTLVNAHTQGLLNRGERGLYTISTVGENLVALALPTDGGTVGVKRSAKKKKAKQKKA